MVSQTSQPTADALGDANAKCAERCAAEVKALCSLPKPHAAFPDSRCLIDAQKSLSTAESVVRVCSGALGMCHCRGCRPDGVDEKQEIG